MEPIKIVGEWRSIERLTPGVWLSRIKGLLGASNAMSISHECQASPDHEYLGPIEIVEPDPVPTLMPGCECNTGTNALNRHWCRSTFNGNIEFQAFGTTLRQAILRHNAAVAAIVALEGK